MANDGHVLLDAQGRRMMRDDGSLDICEACCTMYKLTPCVAPIYELTPCTPSSQCSPCEDAYVLIGVHIEFTGIANRACSCVGGICTPRSCSPYPASLCVTSYCYGTDQQADSVNGGHDLFFESTGDGCAWRNQPVGSNDGLLIYYKPDTIVSAAMYIDGANYGNYFSGTSGSVNCEDETWTVTIANALGGTESIRAGEGGTAVVTPIYNNQNRCPQEPLGSIYTQDESVCYSGTTPIYTNDDLSAYVGKCVVLNTGICYAVTQESGGTAQSVTISASYDDCPPDKYAEYEGKVVTLEVGEDTVCFYMSVGGSESDGEVTILGSYDTCNECCGEAA